MKKIKPAAVILAFVSILLGLIMLLPVVWSLFCSLQHEGRQIVTIWDWFKPPYTLENYPRILSGTSTFRWFFNSFIVAVITTVLTVVVSTLAAYALAKIPFRGSKILYTYFLCGLLVPGEATIVPLFILMNKLGLINSYTGLILPSIASAMTLIITVNFFQTLPNELLEAVRIDGGSELTIYTRIALPLSKPIIATVALMSFIGSWNNYLWPLLCIFSDKLYTMPIGIPTLLNTESPDFVVPMTANMISSLPMIIMFIIFERQVVEGISTQGLKE